MISSLKFGIGLFLGGLFLSGTVFGQAATPVVPEPEPAVYRVESVQMREIEQQLQQRFRNVPGFSLTINADDRPGVTRIGVLADEAVQREIPEILRLYGRLLPKESGKTLVLTERPPDRTNVLREPPPNQAVPARPDPAQMTPLPVSVPSPPPSTPPQVLPIQAPREIPAGSVQTLPTVEQPPNIAFRTPAPVRATPPVAAQAAPPPVVRPPETQYRPPIDQSRDSFTPTHVSLAKIEQLLVHLLGARLNPTAAGRYLLEVPHEGGKKHCSVEFDRQNTRLLIVGERSLCDQLVRLVDTIDQPDPTPGRDRQFIPLRNVKTETVARILEINGSPKKLSGRRFGPPESFDSDQHTPPAQMPKLELRQNEARHLPLPSKGNEQTKHLDARRNPLVQLVGYQFEGDALGGAGPELGGGMPEMDPMGQNAGGPTNVEVVNDFRYTILPELDLVIVDATEAEADKIRRMIREIEELSKMAEVEIEVFFLKHVNCISLNYVIQQIFLQTPMFRTKQGSVTILPMINPNAMLIIGWGKALESMKDLIETLDKPVAAENNLLQVIRLKYASANTVYTTLRATYPPLQPNMPNAFAPRVQMMADVRTNSLIVQAGRNDMKDIERLVAEMDVPGGGPKLQVKHFKLKHTMATDTAQVLTDAIASGTAGTQDRKLPSLQLIVETEEGRRMIESGIMSDVRIARDVRNNMVIVTAPEHAMPLIDEMIKIIDAPSSNAEVEVFQILYGDANAMVLTLRSLIPAKLAGQVGPQLPGLPGAADEETLIPISFAVDTRTNCIIAAGAPKDLQYIEALLVSLDREDQQTRKSEVYNLKSMKAEAVATAINEYVRSKREIQMAAPGVISPYQQIESEVIVIPEVVSNSLIVSATPRFYDEIMQLIAEIDKMPPQVVIQVLIGEVSLGNTKELGMEFGIQDSLLFNRSSFENITQGTRTITRTENGVTTTVEEPVIANGSVIPGWLFNENPSNSLSNGYNSNSANRVGTVGTQLLTNYATGRVGAETGFGGMVFSANSDAVSIMIRALQETNRLEILSRPQITAMNNESAFIHVGQLVPRYEGATMNNVGSQSSIKDKQVGLMLMVKPSISPEGNVVMMVLVEKSKVGSDADGVVVASGSSGEVRSPKIDRIHTMTMISAADNETVVLGGLITKDNQEIKRKVPFLGDIPVLGHLFRYDYNKCTRSELIVILTPRIVRNSCDMETIKQIEAARMSWCVGGVARLHGDIGVYNVTAEQPYAGDATFIYPEAVDMEQLMPIESIPVQQPPGEKKPFPTPTLAPTLPAQQNQATVSSKVPTPVLPKK